MEHILKTWPDVFQDTLEGFKTFEIRKNDRDFQLDDMLFLKEYDPEKDEFTGRTYFARVKYILYGGRFGLPEDYVIMSI